MPEKSNAFATVSEATQIHIISEQTVVDDEGHKQLSSKTLIEVIEDAILGHVMRSAAVLEGQVKIKAVKVKEDGTVISVEKDLGASESNPFGDSHEELVEQEEMPSIADSESSTNGIGVEIVTEEGTEIVFNVATFNESYIDAIRNILIADAESEAGEDDLTQEQIDMIDASVAMVSDALEEIREASQQAINEAAGNVSDD